MKSIEITPRVLSINGKIGTDISTEAQLRRADIEEMQIKQCGSILFSIGEDTAALLRRDLRGLDLSLLDSCRISMTRGSVEITIKDTPDARDMYFHKKLYCR